MSQTSDIAITPGTGADVATYSVTEDSVTKYLQRITLCDSSGNEIFLQTQPQNVSQVAINIASQGDNIIVSAVGGKTVNIYKILFFCNSAVNLVLYSNPANSQHILIPTVTYPVGGSFDYDGDNFPMTCNVGESFNIYLSSPVQVSGRIWYTQS